MLFVLFFLICANYLPTKKKQKTPPHHPSPLIFLNSFSITSCSCVSLTLGFISTSLPVASADGGVFKKCWRPGNSSLFNRLWKDLWALTCPAALNPSNYEVFYWLISSSDDDDVIVFFFPHVVENCATVFVSNRFGSTADGRTLRWRCGRRISCLCGFFLGSFKWRFTKNKAGELNVSGKRRLAGEKSCWFRTPNPLRPISQQGGIFCFSTHQDG